MQRGIQPGRKAGIFPAFGCCERIRRSQDTKGVFLVRSHDEAAASSVTATKILRCCSRALRKTRPHRHLWQTLRFHDSRSCARSPILPTFRKCCTRLYKSSFRPRWFRVSGALSFSSAHSQAFVSPPLPSSATSRTLVASPFPKCLVHVLLVNDSFGPFGLLQQQHLDFPYVLPRYKLHRIQPPQRASHRAFFYNTFAQLLGHLLNELSVKVEFLGDLAVGEVQAHEVQAQNPNLERLMMASKDGAGEIIKTLLAFLAFVALGWGFVGKTSADNMPGFTKRTGAPLRPTKLAYGIVALGIIDKILDVDVYHQSTPHKRETVL